MTKSDPASDMVDAANRGDLRALLHGLVEGLAEVGDVGRVALEAVRAGMALARAEASGEPVPLEAVSFLKFMAAEPTAPAAFKALRQSLNLTQDQVGDLAGVARSTVAEWERGSEPMPINAIRALMQLGAGKFAKVSTDDTVITGADIWALRRALKMPRWAMAEALGVSTPGLIGWEYGRRPISPKSLQRIRVPYRELCARAAAR